MGNVSQIQGKGFAMQPRNLTEAMDFANMLAASQMVPKNYMNKPQDTLVAMMMGSELGLNPIQALQNIAVINGRPSIYGDALVALVQSHSAFGGIEESFDEATMTAYCAVWRKGGNKDTQSFSQSDAQKAGLWGKTGPWQNYPKRMLAWRARGFALRNQFADALAGLITAEEAEDMPVDTAPKDMGEVEVITAAEYPQEKVIKNLPAWARAVKNNRHTFESLVSWVEDSSGLPLTEEQKALIQNEVTAA